MEPKQKKPKRIPRVPLHIRVKPRSLERWRAEAETEGRTLPNWIEHTLDYYVELEDDIAEASMPHNTQKEAP